MGDRVPLKINIDPSLGPEVVEPASPQQSSGLYVTVYEYRWTIIIITIVIVLLAIGFYAFVMRDGDNVRTVPAARQQSQPAPVRPALPPAEITTPAAPDEQALLAARAALMAEKPVEKVEEKTEEKAEEKAEEENMTTEEPAAVVQQEKPAETQPAPYVAPKKCAKLRCKGYATFGDFCEKHSGAK